MLPFVTPKLLFNSNSMTEALPVLSRSNLGDVWRAVVSTATRELGVSVADSLPALLKRDAVRIRHELTLDRLLIPSPIRPYHSGEFLLRAARQAVHNKAFKAALVA